MAEQSVAPAGQKRSRWRVVFLLSLVTCGIAVALLLGIYLYYESQRKRAVDDALADLQAAIAEVDRAELGGWQMEDIERQREQVPDAENSAKVVQAAAKLLPKDWYDGSSESSLDTLAPPLRLREEQAETLQEMIGKLGPALQEARKLIAYPKGRYPPLVLTPDWMSTRIDHTNTASDVATLLFLDAVLLCEQREYKKAWASAEAALNAGRSLGDEPWFVSMLLRLAARGKAVAAMERILAQGQVDEKALSEARSRFRSEQDRNLTAIGIRGERAGQHVFYSNLAKGVINMPDLAKIAAADVVAKWDSMKDRDIPASHAYMLRMLTRAIGCSKKVGKDRDDCLAKWEFDIKDAKGRLTIPLLAGLLTPAVPRVAYAEMRSDILLECAVTALAAEQFRLRAKRWPKDLAELVKAGLLPKIPVDLHDHQPLRLRHAPNGLVIYSLATGHEYEGTAWDNPAEPPLGRERVEFRLWDPAHRRQPAPPPPLPDEPEA
jgi:hypothetical protein